MYVACMSEDPRAALERLAAARGASLSALSRMLGKNVAYLGQYVRRGTPRVLPERDRGALADFFGVDEGVLGASVTRAAPVGVPYLAIAAAAGAGTVPAAERIIRTEPIAADMLRELGIAAASASIIRVEGESMAPDIRDGDRILVDRGETRVARGGGVFVIRRDDLLSVKRLTPLAHGWRVASDNPAYPTVECPRAAVTVIGRARLLLRGL